jgi:hypothetical protein
MAVSMKLMQDAEAFRAAVRGNPRFDPTSKAYDPYGVNVIVDDYEHALDMTALQAHMAQEKTKRQAKLLLESTQKALNSDPGMSMSLQAAITLWQQKFGDTWVDMGLLEFEDDKLFYTIANRLNQFIPTGTVMHGGLCKELMTGCIRITTLDL